MRKGILAGLIIFGLTGCGTEEQSSVLQELDPGETVLFVASSGNMSCGVDDDGDLTPYGTKMYQNLENLLDSLRRGQQQWESVQSIVSCYDSGPTIYYVTSDEPGAIYAEDIDGFYTTVESLALRSEQTRSFITGHSYGGWLAMKTVLNTDVFFDGVFTLDPISRETCTFTQPWGCTESPTDISDEEKLEIADRSTSWHNYYQWETWYLHATEIPQADVNLDLGVPHNSVDTDERVWNAMRTAVLPLSSES